MTKETLARGFALICTAFPNLGLNETTLDVWAMLLEDLDDAPFLSAVIRLCREEKQIYPGTNVVALIRERAVSSNSGIVAVTRLEDAMRTVGGYRSIVFDDPIIHLVVSRMGGWPKLCAMTYDEWKFMRRDFERLYDAACREPIPIDQIPSRLAGILEISNSAHGHNGRPVQMQIYGDERKALEWTGHEKALPENTGNVVKLDLLKIGEINP